MYKLSETQRNKLFKGESILIKPSMIADDGVQYFTRGHHDKIMRKLKKGKGHRVQLTKADFKNLRSKSMEGAGFRSWLRRGWNKVRNTVEDKANEIKRKARNSVQDVKNMVSRDADTRNNAWKKMGMKSANFAAKKLLDKTPLGGIPVVSGLIEDQIDKGFKKAASKAGIEGYGKKKIEFKMKPKKLSNEVDFEGEGIAQDVASYIKSKGSEYIKKKAPELKEKAISKAREKATEYGKKALDKIKPFKKKVQKKISEASDYVDERSKAIDESLDAGNFKLSLQKILDDLRNESSGNGLRLDRRGRGLRLSRGGNIGELFPSQPNPNVYYPNFQSDFLPSNNQSIAGAIPDQIFYGDMMSNSIFKKKPYNPSEISGNQSRDILNPYVQTGDHGFHF